MKESFEPLVHTFPYTSDEYSADDFVWRLRRKMTICEVVENQDDKVEKDETSKKSEITDDSEKINFRWSLQNIGTKDYITPLHHYFASCLNIDNAAKFSVYS